MSAAGLALRRGDWRFSMGTLLGSWPKPTVTADKERSVGEEGERGTLNVKASVIDFKWRRRGREPPLSGCNPSPSPICWQGVLRSAAWMDNAGFAGIMGVTTDQREFFFFFGGVGIAWACVQMKRLLL